MNHKSRCLLVLLSLCQCLLAETFVEDITKDSKEADDETQLTSTQRNSRPQFVTKQSQKTKKSMVDYFSGRKKSDKLEDLRFLPQEEQFSSGGGYGVPHQGKSRPSANTVSRDPGEERQVVAGIPDMSDPCFRRYANCIVVNAQPYERRSSTNLMNCKIHCLHSQTGVYSCRSFVYDNVNQVCDLFAHVGDQSPARLLKFQTRDYFEPTSAVQCLSVNDSPEIVAHASNIDERQGESDKVSVAEKVGLIPQKSTEDEVVGKPCARGKRTGFLRTAGFELFNFDEVSLQVSHVDECTDACEKNSISGRRLECNSFDFDEAALRCSFTKEAAVPVGEGQLKQKNESHYYERICVTENIALGCPAAFHRFPQMILVGFAESVSDSASFEHCFDSCLNSFQLFGFNCTSGMYYFEETQLNCILNSEDRHSQADLFAEENTDIVDYFEVGCQRPRSRGVKTFSTPESTPIRMENLVVAKETQTEWSTCRDGLQHRRRDCASKKGCGLESRACADDVLETTTLQTTAVPSKEEISRLKKKLARDGFDCTTEQCCPVFENNCHFGLRQTSAGQLEWCKSPCESLTNSIELKRRRHRLMRRR